MDALEGLDGVGGGAASDGATAAAALPPARAAAADAAARTQQRRRAAAASAGDATAYDGAPAGPDDASAEAAGDGSGRPRTRMSTGSTVRSKRAARAIAAATADNGVGRDGDGDGDGSDHQRHGDGDSSWDGDDGAAQPPRGRGGDRHGGVGERAELELPAYGGYVASAVPVGYEGAWLPRHRPATRMGGPGAGVPKMHWSQEVRRRRPRCHHAPVSAAARARTRAQQRCALITRRPRCRRCCRRQRRRSRCLGHVRAPTHSR